jgi:hypothetical protein
MGLDYINFPYCYHLYNKETKQHYYGVKWSNKVAPESDLWIKYFGSSKRVKKLIEQYGKDSFEVEIRKIFTDEDRSVAIQKARNWEERVLTRLKIWEKKDVWLNRGINKAIFNDINPNKGISLYSRWLEKYGKEEADKRENIRKEKLRIINEKENHPNWGTKRTPETINRISLSKIGFKHSEETKQRMSESRRGERGSNWGKRRSKETNDKFVKSVCKQLYVVISPEKDVFDNVLSLSQFCKEHQLNSGHMFQMIRGNIRHHKGWTGHIVGKEYLRDKYSNNNK